MSGGVTVGTSVPAVELLAPAGSPEAFVAALAAGADAIYVGLGNDFNARRSAANFDEASFAEATAKAHLAGARVYVTMNIVIKEREMGAALALVCRAWELGADALIIQDWGLLFEVRSRWPEIECHASTQMAIQDPRGCLFACGQGVSRVTLARELSVEEIAACAKTDVEVEVFCHGALCFCYSGLCLMSSLGGVRSANRGLCAQPCRLPYELVDDRGYRVSAPGADRPLCPRDLCTIDDLPALIDAGVSSLKIEGRMKAPEYVYAVVRAYRSKLDELGVRGCSATSGTLDDTGRKELLRRAFNRDFTDAYLWGMSGNEMMSYERSNNRGELVGQVVRSRELGRSRVRRGGRDGGRERLRSVSRAEIEIALRCPVGSGDLLELRPIDDPTQFITASVPADARRDSRIVVRAARGVPVGSTVRVIRSQAALDAVGRVDSRYPRLRPVDIRVTARLGEPLCVELATSDGAAQAHATGPVVEPARTRAVQADELTSHAARLGGTPFVASDAAACLDEGVGLSFATVHEVRARAADALAEALLSPYRHDVRHMASPDEEDLDLHRRFLRNNDPRYSAEGHGSRSADVCVLVPDARTAWAAVHSGATHLYAGEEAFDDVRRAVGGRVPVVPWLDEVCREGDHARLDRLVSEDRAVVVSNVSELALACERSARPELAPCVPVHNASALLALERLGVVGVWLSSELALDELRTLSATSRVPLGLFVFGRTRAMTSEHCVLQAGVGCRNDCAHCELRAHAHFLVSPKGDRHPVTSDAYGRSRIWAQRPLDVIPYIAELVGMGLTRLMVDATLLSPSAVTTAVRRVSTALAAARHEKGLPARQHGSTVGHLFEGVE